MQSTTATTVVRAEPGGTYSAVLELAAALWSVIDDDIVHADPPGAVIHRVRLDGETACWLAWTLTGSADGTTNVQLTHDDADLRDAPAPDLDGVLAALARSIDEASIK